MYRETPAQCPGEAREVKARQSIQKTSLAQLLILLASIALMVAATGTLTETFSIRPHPLFGAEAKP